MEIDVTDDHVINQCSNERRLLKTKSQGRIQVDGMEEFIKTKREDLLKMKHFWKQAITSLMAISIVAAFLSGCGNQDATSSSSGQTASAVNSDSTDSSDSTEQQLHLIKCLIPNNTNTYIKFDEREKYSYWTEFTAALARRGVELDLEIVPSDQFQTVSQTRLASASDLPDYVVLSYLDQETCVNLAKQGMLIPLDKILEHSDGTAKDFLNGPIDYSRKLNTLDDGKQYWFSSVLITTWGDTVCQSPVVPNIRKDWLDKLGLEVPETLDDFYNALVAFRENDMNGNGLNDEVVICPANFSKNPLAAWFGLGTELATVRTDTEEVVCPWYQTEQMKAFITYMKKLVDAGVLDLSIVTGNSDLESQAIAENRGSCINTYATQRFMESSVNTNGAAAAEYLPFGPITGIEGTPAYATGDSATLSYHKFAFTKNCTDLDGAAKLLDFFCSDEYTMFFEWGVEGETYEIVDGKPQFLEGVGQQYWEEMSKKGLTNGLWLHFGAFPRVYPGQNLKETEKEAASYKLDYMDKFSKYEYKTLLTGFETAYMALPTDEEIQVKNQVYPDLATYSDETFVNFITGKYSLDDYDTYVKEMQELGLDDYLKVMTDRYDRYRNS